MAPALPVIGAIIAAALLPTLTSAFLNSTLYAVTVSSQLTGGSNETLCAHLHLPIELPCPICLKVKLQIQKKKIKETLLVQEGIVSKLHRCYDFKVPRVKTRTVATIIVEIKADSESITKETKVELVPPAFINLITSDKPIYKPGQTIMFRIVSLTSGLLPVTRVYDLVEIVDPDSNRIAQWLHVPCVNGIVDLSHLTVSDGLIGTYQINVVTELGEKFSHSVKVEKFVLPKFEVTVTMPGIITYFDKDLRFKVCGKFTFGKPVVRGSVKVQFCVVGFPFWGIKLPEGATDCKTFQLETDASGCASQLVIMTEFFKTKSFSIQYFEVTAELMESGTGSTMTGSGRTTLKNNIRTVTYMGLAPNYKPGLKFDGRIKLTDPNDRPAAGEEVFLSGATPDTITLKTDADGIAHFSLDTNLWEDSVTLVARPTEPKETFTDLQTSVRPNYISAYHTAVRFYSKSNSFVKLLYADGDLYCDKEVTLRAEYIINKEELLRCQDSIKFHYQVMSRGSLKQHNIIEASAVNGVGEMSIRIGRAINLAPVAQVVIYTSLLNGELVADSMDFPVQRCWRNKVSLKFPHVQQLPAEQTKLHLTAEPGSLCSVKAIDLSILLLEDEPELTVDSVYEQLPVQKLSGYSFDIEDDDRHSCPFGPFGPFGPFPGPIPRPVPLPIVEPEPPVLFEPGPLLNEEPEALPPVEPDNESGDAVVPPLRGRRSAIFPPFLLDERDDVYSVFKGIGIKLVTNMEVDKPCPKPPPGFVPPVAFDAPLLRQEEAVQAAPLQEKAEGGQEAVRSFFPDTWIWDLVRVGDDGWTKVKKTVPDTITKWVAGAFCVSPVGFGVSPNTGLTVSKPLFVSLTLPYSIIRGELFVLKATVFSDLPKCIQVKVTLAESSEHTFKKCNDCQYIVCLCKDKSITVTWTVTPKIIGLVGLKVSAEALKDTSLCGGKPAIFPKNNRMDTVIRTLPVEAEGIRQSVTQNALLCPADTSVQEEFSLVLPEIFVEGSAKASVSVLGDLMGRALKNIDQLLQMPYGCGEQNMLRLAPNIYVLLYLKNTVQLTSEILNRAIVFLESGYQRQLTYKHDDGAFSAFGESDESGNTWLTAFVMRTFGQGRDFIYVDPKVIDGARAWLSKLQNKDGCIKSVGKLFHNEMKGGVSDEVTLTGYVVIAFLELKVKPSDPVVSKCLDCLRNALKGKIDNLYTKALLSYTFTLAGDAVIRTQLITELHSKATTVGGSRHWVRPGASTSRLDSLEVEMTSYVLLALLSAPPEMAIDGFGIAYSVTIVNWLVKQQNAFGGFSSTQDTVTALQALALYASITYKKEGTITVTVSSEGGQNIKFHVDQSNRLLLQEETLNQVPGEYTVQAAGEGCVLVQMSMTYNIPPPNDFSTFKISAKTLGECEKVKPQVLIFIEVGFNDDLRGKTNMVILEVKLLSGYTPNEDSLKRLLETKIVKRVEVEDGRIMIYLDELQSDFQVRFEVTLEKDTEVTVSDLKPASIRIYDYYKTSDEASIDYTSPCE